MSDDETFWAAARLGPVVETARTIEALREEVGQLRWVLASVIQALDRRARFLSGKPEGNEPLATALHRARALLHQTAAS